MSARERIEAAGVSTYDLLNELAGLEDGQSDDTPALDRLLAAPARAELEAELLERIRSDLFKIIQYVSVLEMPGAPPGAKSAALETARELHRIVGKAALSPGAPAERGGKA